MVTTAVQLPVYGQRMPDLKAERFYAEWPSIPWLP